MSVFAVTYTYGDDELVQQFRPTHREWLALQLEQGTLLASGPMVNRNAALLIWRAESVEELNHLLDQDPFDVVGAISERTIEEWNTVFGPWS